MGVGSKALDAIEFMRDKIVSGGNTVYTQFAPQSATYPYVLLSIISLEPSPTQDSGSAVDSYRVQVDCYAKASAAASGFYTAHELAREVRALVSRQTDTATYNNDIDGVQEVNHLEDYIPEIDVTRVTKDFIVRVK